MSDPLPYYPWPGPFEAPLPSGGEITATLYYQPGTSDEPVVVIEGRRLEELSSKDVSYIRALSDQVGHAAESYFVRAVRVGADQLRIERKPITVSFGIPLALGFAPMTPQIWELVKSRKWSDCL